MVKGNIGGYIIAEGIKSVFKQKKMTTASIVIMCATMFIFGIFFLIGENVNYAMKQLESQQGMRVIIKDDAKEDTIKDLKTKILGVEGVNKVKFISKEEALASVKNRLGNHQDLLAGYDEDIPFPATYFVTLTDLSKNMEVQNKIKQFPGVDEITSPNDTIANLSKVAKAFQNVTLFILALLILISIFIIAYTIKLTVYARRREINIMKYVGATNGFIRGPFIVEGMVLGIVSAIISLLIIDFGYNGLMKQIAKSAVMKNIGISLYTFQSLYIKLFIVYLIMGIGIGVIGSIISMRKYLKV